MKMSEFLTTFSWYHENMWKAADLSKYELNYDIQTKLYNVIFASKWRQKMQKYFGRISFFMDKKNIWNAANIYMDLGLYTNT